MSLGPYHDELYEQVLPMHGPDPDGLAQDLVGAWCHGVIEVDELVRDTDEGPGWGVILDVDMAPAKGLRWLAQLAGVELRAPKQVLRASNLLVNSSFETTTTVWTASFGTATRVANGLATHGPTHLHAASTSGASVAALLWGAGITPTPASTYTLSVDVLAASQAVRLHIRWFDGFTPLTDVYSGSITTPGRYSLVAVAPAIADGVSVRVELVTATNGATFDVDGITFLEGTRADYFGDGDLLTLETDDEWAAYARQAIREQGAKFRGTRRAMLDAVRDTLTGSKFVSLLERVGGNAYALTLVTRPSETPDPALTLATAERQKPLGMKITHTLTEGVLIDEGTKTIDGSSATIDTATLTDVAT